MSVTGGQNVFVNYYQDGIDHVVGATPRINSVKLACEAEVAAVAGASNQTVVTVTVKDNNNEALAWCNSFDFWLSDDSDGKGLSATTPDAVAASAGALLLSDTANKFHRAQTNESGIFTVGITDAAKPTYYICVKLDSFPQPFILHLTTGNYG
jgi:hypothetical protein